MKVAAKSVHPKKQAENKERKVNWQDQSFLNLNVGNMSMQESVCLSSARKVSGGLDRKVVISEVEYRVEELIEESALSSEMQQATEIDPELDEILAKSDLHSKSFSDNEQKAIEKPAVQLDLIKKNSCYSNQSIRNRTKSSNNVVKKDTLDNLSTDKKVVRGEKSPTMLHSSKRFGPMSKSSFGENTPIFAATLANQTPQS